MGGARVWVAPVASGVLLAATGAMHVGGDLQSDHFVSDILPNAVLALVLPLLGAFVLAQLPRHPLGMLWVATGLAGALTLTIHSYADLATRSGSASLPLALPAAWASSWFWVLGSTPLLTFGLLLFPDGRLPSRRWRPLLVVDSGAMLLPILGQALKPGRLEETPLDNPIGSPALAELCQVLNSVGFLCFTLGAAAGALSLVLRWRRGSAEARQKLALPALAAGLLGATFLVPTSKALAPWLDAVVVAEVSLLLATFGVAVLRDRITGEQVVVRRSLTYGLLTGALAVSYAGAVAGLSTVLDGRGSDLLATLVVALLALPLRDRLQAVVDRALYGEREDPFAALDQLGRRMDSADDPEAVLQGVAEAVATILRLPSVQVVVRREEGEAVAASVGADTGSWTRLALQHRGEEVGALLVAPRAGQLSLDPRDVRMLEALQRQAGSAVASVRLSSELQQSRQRIVAAREEERRRLRRDLHDGLGPTLAGIGLGLEVAQVADDPQQVERLLIELKEAAAAAVVDVRRLVEDLRPPALDELGLVGALRRHADRLNLGGSPLVEVTATTPLDGLPAAVEVAAYRIAMEALTNAVKHGRPRHCTVELHAGDVLRLEVSDDGDGLPAVPREGVGLGAMRERAAELGGTCTVNRRAGAGGTVVRACIPLAAP